MRDYKQEYENRISFIKETLGEAGATGIVLGNSGGKDSALVLILCKAACENTLGVIMPCASTQNYGSDKSDAEKLAEQFGIETRIVDLTTARESLVKAIGADLSQNALSNIAPRLRMTTLYAIAMNENRLVAGTGNRSEAYMGYFTKWGDGAHDFNPIADLTATEIFEFLRFLKAPASIIEKPPSAGLFEGQTDEAEMGITYARIDDYLLNGRATDADKALIEQFHTRTAHKRRMPKAFGNSGENK